MNRQKKLTWEERHPNGDVSHHTFFEGRRGKIIRDYEGIPLHIPHSSTSFPPETTYSFTDLDEEESSL